MKIRTVSAAAIILTAILLLTGTVFAADSPAPAGDDAADALAKGVRAYKAGNYDKAIKYFRNALKSDPGLTVAQLYLATSIAHGFVPGKMSDKNIAVANEAITEFEKVLVMEPSNTTALRSIASIYFKIQKLDKAREIRRRLVEIDPENPEHYISIGLINYVLAFEASHIIRAELGIKDKLDEPLPDEQVIALEAEFGDLLQEGIEGLEKANKLKPKSFQIVTYLTLIYYLKAEITMDPAARADVLRRAEELAQQANEMQKQLGQDRP